MDNKKIEEYFLDPMDQEADGDFFFNTLDEEHVKRDKRYFVLVIYDISSNKKRNKMVKVLNSYGFRVQKSAFEALIRQEKYDKMIRDIESIPDEEDSVRIYKIRGEGAVTIFGDQWSAEEEEVVII